MNPVLTAISSVLPALVGGLFLAAGWVYNGQLNRRRDAALRAERVRDVQQALYAEIRAYLAVLERDRVAEYGENIARKIEDKEKPAYFPVIPTERYDTVFQAIVKEIHILPRETVDPVVLYYTQLGAISALISDLRALDVATIGKERGAAMYRDYIDLKVEAMVLARQAQSAIDAHLLSENGTILHSVDSPEESKKRAEALRAELNDMKKSLNTPDVVRSGP